MSRMLIATLLGGFALVAVTVSPVLAGDDCTIAKDATSEVGKACKEGGIKRAKAVMKAMTKEAKKKGVKHDCDTCHKNETDWVLTDGAKDKFKEMLAALGK